MARAILPEKLPGSMFLLVWDRDRERFFIHVDDENYSSYDLGSEIQDVRLRFKLWGQREIGDRAIDVARELGAAKALLADGRVVAVFDRKKNREATVKFEEEGDAGRAHARSALRAYS